MSQSRQEKPQAAIMKSMIYGGVAGTAEVMINHPFWSMKTRKQKRMPFTVDLRVLYRGIIPNTMSMMPITAMQTATFEIIKAAFFPDAIKMSAAQVIGSAFMSGATVASISGPIEMVMTHQEKDRGFMQSARYLVKQGGWKGIYNGVGATVLRDGIFTAGYLAGAPMMKDMVKAYISHEFSAKVTAGVAAGIAATLISQPFDTIKTMQQAAIPSQRLTFKQAASKIYSEAGAAGFFTGGMWRGARVVSAVTVMNIINSELKAKFG
jgi:solute carrier family 25 citrate transporter 1